MAHVQGGTRKAASLRIVFGDGFGNGVVSVPVSTATTFGDLARAVRRMSAQRRSDAAAVAVTFADDRTAGRAFRARRYELPDPAFSGKARRFSQADFDA